MAQRSSPHQQYVRILMDRVGNDQYPSSSDLDRLERSMTTADEYREYLDFLLNRVDESRPSPQMMDRLERLLAMIPADNSG